jgi:hypothetical protein
MTRNVDAEDFATPQFGALPGILKRKPERFEELWRIVFTELKWMR